MSSVHTDESGSPRRSLEFQIVNWPLRDDPVYAGSVLFGCMAVGGFAGWWAGSWHMGLLSMAAVMATVWKLWVPMTCHVGAAGITVGVFRWRRRIAWREIDHLESRPHGIIVERGAHAHILGKRPSLTSRSFSGSHS